MYEKLVKMLFFPRVQCCAIGKTSYGLDSRECNAALSGKGCIASFPESATLRYREMAP